MKRIIIHWTAGGHTPSVLDLRHYHFVVSGDGEVIPGTLPVLANKSPLSKNYAAHTLNCNSDSIGIAMAAMSGAIERPFSTGRFPIKTVQYAALVNKIAELSLAYNIPVTRETILTHAEVQPTLKIKQRGKWDITWLPGMGGPADPIVVGDEIRAAVRDALKEKARPTAPPAITAPKQERKSPMTMTHLRVIFYFLAPLLGMLPGVTYGADAQQIIIDLKVATGGIAAGGGLSALVFKKWGKI